MAGFDTVYLIWGFLSHRFSAGDAEATGTVLAFLCLGLAGWGRTNRHQSRLLCARQHLAADCCVDRRRILRSTALHFPSSAVRRNRSGNCKRNCDFVYVLLLSWLQYRRFNCEAGARGDDLNRVYGILDPALRMAFACCVAIGGGYLIRLLLPQFFLRYGFLCPSVAQRNALPYRPWHLFDYYSAIGDS